MIVRAPSHEPLHASSRRAAELGRDCRACTAAGAQLDIRARIAPQFYSYKIASPSSMTISEFAVPLFVQVPVTQRLSFDIGTSFAQARVQQTGTATAVSTISGLTDTQIRGNLSLGTDFVILTGGVNLPTGKSTVPVDQQRAAGLIGSDFFSFPISNMGTGFGGTGGIVVARPVGDWNVGVGLSVRHSAQYDPFDAVGGPALDTTSPGTNTARESGPITQSARDASRSGSPIRHSATTSSQARSTIRAIAICRSSSSATRSARAEFRSPVGTCSGRAVRWWTERCSTTRTSRTGCWRTPSLSARSFSNRTSKDVHGCRSGHPRAFWERLACEWCSTPAASRSSRVAASPWDRSPRRRQRWSRRQPR